MEVKGYYITSFFFAGGGGGGEDQDFNMFNIGGFHTTQVSLIITQVKNKIAYHS